MPEYHTRVVAETITKEDFPEKIEIIKSRKGSFYRFFCEVNKANVVRRRVINRD